MMIPFSKLTSRQAMLSNLFELITHLKTPPVINDEFILECKFGDPTKRLIMK